MNVEEKSDVILNDIVMLNENEVIMLLLGIIVFVLILLNGTRIRRIYAWRVFVTSYCLLLAGWFFTILEGFFLEFYLNILEHLSYTFSAIFMAFWCWKVVNSNKVEG
jgi:hypothetical protein